ncbi:bifunctional hydroxymethylpyrimidine kinase/phosphomethylpyrimidine kinase, partial [Rhodospirillaceae bacterium]|nr:bifunctional hydroxymethylpyrimidine kinase/phosphomethylpyrimidine kinase [Rhodospirillaceae bacterium]
MTGRVLICAGSDSGGGAGIQADIKTVTALGGFASTALTALTAQNTTGVFSIQEVPIDFIAEQMRVILSDLGADCIKTGMLHNVEVIETVAEVIEREVLNIYLVVDPVMVAKGGHRLLDVSALDALKSLMVTKADLLTPNIPEAKLLTGLNIKDLDTMRRAAYKILELGAKAVLLKGGHLDSEILTDLLVTKNSEQTYSGPRLNTKHTHGTGCTMASAIATCIAQDCPLEEAVQRARDFVFKAIQTAPGIGNGNGPLNHAHTVVIKNEKTMD